MVKPYTEDRRQTLRAKRILSIQFRIVKSKVRNYHPEWHLSTTHDMSYSGLAFLSDIPVQVDDILELNVVMSGILDIYKGFGKVVRIEKKETGAFYLVGIKFVQHPPAAAKAKKTAAKKRLPIKKKTTARAAVK